MTSSRQGHPLNGFLTPLTEVLREVKSVETRHTSCEREGGTVGSNESFPSNQFHRAGYHLAVMSTKTDVFIQ